MPDMPRRDPVSQNLSRTGVAITVGSISVCAGSMDSKDACTDVGPQSIRLMI